MSVAFVEPPLTYRLLQQPHRVAGTGWTANIHEDEIELTVTPEGDVLPKALRKLFSPHQIRYWTYVWDHEDAHGRDVYLLTRGKATAI